MQGGLANFRNAKFSGYADFYETKTRRWDFKNFPKVDAHFSDTPFCSVAMDPRKENLNAIRA